MLIDTGAQISLINKNIIQNQSLIDERNKITISSIHGSENTLGNISAIIQKDDTQIPIQLQVTKNIALKEDGILGYDVIGEKGIINGPNKILTLKSNDKNIEFPIKTDDRIQNINLVTIKEEIEELHRVEYLEYNEINPQYDVNMLKVQNITEQLDENKIRIKPLNTQS